jgi:hypothetical protein
MKLLYLSLLLMIGACGYTDDANSTICPCKVISVKLDGKIYEVTVKGNWDVAGDGHDHSSEFMFKSMSEYKIGEIVK